MSDLVNSYILLAFILLGYLCPKATAMKPKIVKTGTVVEVQYKLFGIL